MMIDAEALRSHARDVSSERLRLRRRRLRHLTPHELKAVAETADAISQAVADCLLETAASDASVATVLASLYPVGNGTARG
jgi:hypothetical protein